jgi:hypothetical protein
MPIDPISWIIIAVAAAAITTTFWDEIKEWAGYILEGIIDAINEAVEVASDGIVYLVKKGNRIYRRIEVYVRNVNSGETRLETRQEEIADSDIPEDILADLQKQQKTKLMQSQRKR